MPRAKTVAAASATEPIMVTNPYSFQSFINFINNNFVMLLLVGLFFVGGFAIGSLWTENQLLKGGTRPSALADAPVAPAAPAGPTGPTPEQLGALPEISDADHVRGNANANIVLVEYSDFECPFCARFHPTMLQVMDEFGDEVAWVYRHYPLPFHPNAQKAAEASECVAELGGEEAFWNYSDAIVKSTETAGQLSAEAIKTAATGAGVSEAAFTECLDSGRMAAVVQNHMDKGAAAGVSGTPGTFIVVDGEAKELIPGALPFAQVQTMIQQYL